jgi:hypothetical protein
MTSAATTENPCYIILLHYHDYHYHHSAMFILYLLSQELHWGTVCQRKHTMRVYYESAAASLSRSFCFDKAFILRM